MPKNSQSSLSLEYVWVQVTARGTAGMLNPTVDSLQMAFTSVGVDPVPGDWHPGLWVTVTTSDTGAPLQTPTYWATILVGPAGTVVLAKGTYNVWVDSADNPERPKDPAGTYIIT